MRSPGSLLHVLYTFNLRPVLRYIASVFGVFVVRIFSHSDCPNVFSSNVGKYEPEKLQMRKIFTQWCNNRKSKTQIGFLLLRQYMEHTVKLAVSGHTPIVG